MLQAGELELPAGTTILAVLRSLLDADMLTKSSAASKPGVGGGVASGLGGGVASGAYCFKHASVQAVAEHVLSQAPKLNPNPNPKPNPNTHPNPNPNPNPDPNPNPNPHP